jgi:hypothetical protein
MHDIESIHKILSHPKNSFVHSINEFSRVLFLPPHFDVYVDLLENWEQILLPKQPSHLTKHVEPVFQIVVSEGTKQCLLNGARKINQQVLIVVKS